ncbi:MAG: shikimate dehydrogenase [Saprospiraceae bacterium]|nr:shikimate dehydrogenase [Saprospiraceae bacterium]
MRRFGIIGYPLGHSFSPPYFANKFQELGIEDSEYKAYPITSIKDFPSLITDDLVGLNVTIPYKEAVIPYMDELSDAARKIKAVNTIFQKDGKLIGHNTDYYGFMKSLIDLIDGEDVKAALVLGTGGSSKAVCYALSAMGISYSLVSRNPDYLSYSDLTEDVIKKHQLIINTTPLGMSPHIHASPLINFIYLNDQHFCYDLIYNPEKTLFLEKAEQHGATIKNGHDMLILQAEKSWQIWNQ